LNPEQLLTHFDRISQALDAIPRLRRFILDLAVRGKLVEQDPRDEPASELLKRIQAEKARLEKTGKIRKQKTQPEIGPGEIRFEHLKPCIDWWGGAKRKGRKETEVAWKVTAEEVKARGYNLDFKNPHTVAADHGDPEELLQKLAAAEKETAVLRDQLKAILEKALLR